MKHLATFLAAILLSLVLAVSAAAQSNDDATLSDKAAEELGKLKELVDGKRYDEALQRIERFLPTLAQPSYDRAIFHQVQAQLNLIQNREKEAIRPLELALAQGKLDLKTSQEFRFYLGQLHFSTENYTQSLKWIEEWLANGAKPTVDQSLVYGTLLYQLEKYDRVLEAVKASMLTTPRPREQQLILKLAAQQSLKDWKGCAETLEMLVRDKPDSASYWNQLLQTYLADSRELAGIVTIERGMRRGQFSTEKDYYLLVGLYYNAEQYQAAAALIENGFKTNKLSPEQPNWELLAYCYQQMKDFDRAVDALGRASAVVKSGEVDMMRSQLLYSLGRPKEALAASRKAFEKGGLRQPERALILWASFALELRDREEARKAIAEMAKLAEPPEELEQLKAALNELGEAA